VRLAVTPPAAVVAVANIGVHLLRKIHSTGFSLIAEISVVDLDPHPVDT
jgi:hypothetical protein